MTRPSAASVMGTAVCIEDWHIEAENGDRQDCKRGNIYTVSKPWGDGTVTVCSTFWVRAPERIFGGWKPLSAATDDGGSQK